MTAFLVERYLAGWSADAMADLVDRLGVASAQFHHRHVHYCGSIVLPADETCLCLFEGPDAHTVEAANVAAGFPVDRVVAAQPSGIMPS